MVLVAALVLVGCADDRATLSSPTSRAESRPRRAAAARMPAGDVPWEVVHVAGIVATDLDEPVEGRTVVLIDARGERREAVTDGAGVFAVDAVTAPYDLAVGGAQGGSHVFLGLRRSDPWIEVPERREAAPAPPSELVRVGVRVDACSPRGSVTVVTTSASGGGSSTVECGVAPIVVEVEHAWRARAVASEERIVAHVLASDAERASFAYARAEEIPARPGEAVEIGVLDPRPLEATAPLSFGARVGALENWTWTTEVLLDVAGTGAGFVLDQALGPQVTTRIPIIPGASLRISASAVHPRSDGRVGFSRSAQAWSGAIALSSPAPLLHVEAGPDIARPEPGAELASDRGGFAWRSARGSLATLSVADVAGGILRFRVHTNDDEVSFRRLAMLGVPRLLPGEHALELSASEGYGVDNACSPDPAVRRERVDRGSPGAMTSLRIPFRVTSP